MPLSASVRQVLSGTDDGQSAIVAAIGKPPGAPGWFTPDRPIWTVHGSVTTFVGGIRALLLQSVHPLALAGVQQHSSYRADPFGRLQRTGAFIAATTYGDEVLADRTVSAVRGLHERVVGTAPDGRPYSAEDQRLLTWVHVTLADSMLWAYLRYGRSGEIDADGYVADMARIGERMGVADPPRTQRGLQLTLSGFESEAEGGPQALQMRDFIMQAPLPRGLRPGYALLVRAAVAGLPGWSRELLDLPARQGPLARLRTGAVEGLTDLALRTLARALVESPARAAAEARLGLRPSAH